MPALCLNLKPEAKDAPGPDQAAAAGGSDKGGLQVCYSQEQRQCFRTGKDKSVEWGEWLSPLDDAAENEPMVCRWASDGMAFVCHDFLVADFKSGGTAALPAKASSGGKKKQAKQAVNEYYGKRGIDECEVRVVVKKDRNPLAVVEIKEKEGKWSQKCQLSSVKAGTLEVAIKLLVDIAKEFAEGQIESDDFYSLRDAKLSLSKQDNNIGGPQADSDDELLQVVKKPATAKARSKNKGCQPKASESNGVAEAAELQAAGSQSVDAPDGHHGEAGASLAAGSKKRKIRKPDPKDDQANESQEAESEQDDSEHDEPEDPAEVAQDSEEDSGCSPTQPEDTFKDGQDSWSAATQPGIPVSWLVEEPTDPEDEQPSEEEKPKKRARKIQARRSKANLNDDGNHGTSHADA